MARILVVGDVMRDVYYNVASVKENPEDNEITCVVNPIKVMTCLGGAANVAKSLADTSHEVMLLCTTGDRHVLELLKQEEIEAINVFSRDFICVKERYLHEGRVINRVDTDPLGEVRRSALLRALKFNIDKADIIVTSDYDKGTIFEDLLDVITASGKLWIADAKNTFFDAYSTPNIVLKMNSKELQHFTGSDTYDGIAKIRKRISGKCIVTSGNKSVILITPKATHTFSVDPVEPKSIIGAGDLFLAALVDCLAFGTDMDKSIEVAIETVGLNITQKQFTVSWGGEPNPLLPCNRCGKFISYTENKARGTILLATNCKETECPYPYTEQEQSVDRILRRFRANDIY